MTSSHQSLLHEVQAPETRKTIERKENLPLVEDDKVREYLSKLDIWKSTWALMGCTHKY